MADDKRCGCGDPATMQLVTAHPLSPTTTYLEWVCPPCHQRRTKGKRK